MRPGCLLFACVLVGCSGGPGGGTHPDAGEVDAGVDGGTDAGIDGGVLPPDAGPPDAGGGVVHYMVTDLGDLGGGASEAHAINAVGQVVGRSVNDAFWAVVNGFLAVLHPQNIARVMRFGSA